MIILDLPPEMLGEIANFVTNWKSWIFTCKTFAKMNSLEKIRKRSNHLLTLLNMYPKAWWDYNEGLLMNPNMTLQYVQDHPDKNWDYEMGLYLPGVTWEDIESNPHLDWNFDYLSEFVPLNYVTDHPEKDWDYVNMSHNPNLTWEFIKAHPDVKWKTGVICDFLDTTAVNNDPDKSLIFKPSDYQIHYSGLTLAEIKDQFGPTLDRWALSEVAKITYADIEANPDIDWVDKYILHNKYFVENTNDILALCNKTDMSKISLECVTWITLDLMEANPHIQWHYDVLANPNITWDDILMTTLFDRSAKAFRDAASKNPNLTWDIVQTLINKYRIFCPSRTRSPILNFWSISDNRFQYKAS